VKTSKILTPWEKKVLARAGKGPQGRVDAPGLTKVVNFCHLVSVKIQLVFIKGHIGHGNLSQYKLIK
jgi:hypothetical protein